VSFKLVQENNMEFVSKPWRGETLQIRKLTKANMDEIGSFGWSRLSPLERYRRVVEMGLAGYGNVRRIVAAMEPESVEEIVMLVAEANGLLQQADSPATEALSVFLQEEVDNCII
jgi:hypothetical protein